MTARVRWHEDFRKTAGERRPGLVREVRERSNQHRIRQIGINKEVVNLDGERMRGQRWAQRRKRFNFYFNGLSIVADLTKSIDPNWILTCLTV